MKGQGEDVGGWRRVRWFLSHESGAFAQFVKYGVIGVLATCVQTGVFYVLAATCLTRRRLGRQGGIPAVRESS